MLPVNGRGAGRGLNGRMGVSPLPARPDFLELLLSFRGSEGARGHKKRPGGCPPGLWITASLRYGPLMGEQGIAASMVPLCE
jgi:hypothetical protein